jgi:hypothetical protein
VQIVSEAGSLGRPPRSRRSSLGGRRIETEGGIDEAQEEEEEAEAHVEEEEPQVEVEEVEVDNDEGLHADTGKARGREKKGGRFCKGWCDG